MEKGGGKKRREKEKFLLLIMSNPIDAVLLLSDLHIPCSQRPGNWAQLMLANHESLILNFNSVISVTRAVLRQEASGITLPLKTMTGLAGSVLQQPLILFTAFLVFERLLSPPGLLPAHHSVQDFLTGTCEAGVFQGWET